MKVNELKICVLDIETFYDIFLVCCYIPHTGQRISYEVSFRKNEIDGLVKMLREADYDYYCTFNGVNFDGQVLQFILDNHEKWYDKEWKEVVMLIALFAGEIIDNQNYEIQPPYKEAYMDIKQIDIFKIFHYDNMARACSLKWAGEFSLDGDIEELPIDHRKEGLTEQDLDDVVSYCWNDVMATYNLYKVAIGETEHPDYKGKDKIQLRLDLINEMELPGIAINWNDVKIGAELNKKAYMELSDINQQKLWDKVKGRKLRSSFTFGDCFPKYMKFETKEFQEFFKKISKTKIDLNQKQEFPFSYNSTTYKFAKGGGHSEDPARIVKPDNTQLLVDADVGSMYPNIIRKRNLYPVHLGSKWNEAYISNIGKRLEAKKKYKETKDKKYDNFQECYKLVLNGNFG